MVVRFATAAFRLAEHILRVFVTVAIGKWTVNAIVERLVGKLLQGVTDARNGGTRHQESVGVVPVCNLLRARILGEAEFHQSVDAGSMHDTANTLEQRRIRTHAA